MCYFASSNRSKKNGFCKEVYKSLDKEFMWAVVWSIKKRIYYSSRLKIFKKNWLIIWSQYRELYILSVHLACFSTRFIATFENFDYYDHMITYLLIKRHFYVLFISLFVCVFLATTACSNIYLPVSYFLLNVLLLRQHKKPNYESIFWLLIELYLGNLRKEGENGE